MPVNPAMPMEGFAPSAFVMRRPVFLRLREDEDAIEVAHETYIPARRKRHLTAVITSVYDFLSDKR